MKISFHSHANKTNIQKKRFALSLAFIMRFTATRKWPIYKLPRTQSAELQSDQVPITHLMFEGSMVFFISSTASDNDLNSKVLRSFSASD